MCLVFSISCGKFFCSAIFFLFMNNPVKAVIFVMWLFARTFRRMRNLCYIMSLAAQNALYSVEFVERFYGRKVVYVETKYLVAYL